MESPSLTLLQATSEYLYNPGCINIHVCALAKRKNRLAIEQYYNMVLLEIFNLL